MSHDEEMIEPQEASSKHSKMGIASFIISIVQGIVTMVTMVMAGVVTTWGPQAEHQTAFMIIGFIIFGGIFAHITGTGLGIAGVCQRNSKKVFSVLGLILNFGAVLVILLIMGIGIVATRNM